jgi:glycosyltransferase involved in cell wall biosynthesis
MPNMIRVMRIISRMNVGGPARCVLNLTAGLDHGEFETLVVTGTPGPGEGDLSDRVAAAGGRLVKVPAMNRSVSLFRDARALIALMSLVKSFRPHIVHTHASKAGLLGRAAALWSRLPVGIVHTFHGHVLDGYFSPLKSSLFRELERLLAARTDVIIAVTRSVQQELIERHGVGTAGQYRVIPSGGQAFTEYADADAVRSLRRELGLQAGLVAGVVARLVPVKGHHVLMAALPRILSEIPDLKILLSGDGPLRSHLEDSFRGRRERDALVFLGFRDDVGRVLQSLDLVILPSLKEGLPTALIEAAAAGVPIVASRIPGVTDLVTDGISAMLFEPGSSAGLAEAVIRLGRDVELRQHLAHAARIAAARIMNPEQVVAAHAELYKNLYARSTGTLS